MKKSMQTQFKFKLLKSEVEYERALARLDDLFHASPSSPAGQEAELLALLVEDYEENYYPIPAVDPIDSIRIRMEELQLRQKDLVDAIGSEGIVSEVLNRKRKLNIKMVRALSEKLKLSAAVLIRDYELTR